MKINGFERFFAENTGFKKNPVGNKLIVILFSNFLCTKG